MVILLTYPPTFGGSGCLDEEGPEGLLDVHGTALAGLRRRTQQASARYELVSDLCMGLLRGSLG